MSDLNIDTSDSDILIARRFVAGMLGLAFAAPGVVGIVNGLGNLIPAVGRRIPYDSFLLKPPNSIEICACCLIGGIFFLLFAVAIIVIGWTPTGGGPDYPHGERFRNAASLRMLTGQAAFFIPGILFLLFGIGLCVTLHLSNVAMILGGLFLIGISSAIQPY